MIDFIFSAQFITGVFVGAFFGVSMYAIIIAGAQWDEEMTKRIQREFYQKKEE